MEMGKLIEPRYILSNNTSAIQLVRNRQAGQPAKRMDTRHHFTRNLCQDKYLEIIYINMADYKASRCTKTVATKIHKSHQHNTQNRQLKFITIMMS